MVRIGCIDVILKMAADAGNRSACKTAAGMTLFAIQTGVGTLQGESGKARVIKGGNPTIHGVTEIALCGKAC